MIIEGQKFLRKEILDWLIENYKIKIYYLSVDRNLLDKRSEERNSWWDKERTDKRTLNEIKRMNKIHCRDYISFLYLIDTKIIYE